MVNVKTITGLGEKFKKIGDTTSGLFSSDSVLDTEIISKLSSSCNISISVPDIYTKCRNACFKKCSIGRLEMDNSNYAIKTYEAVLMPIEDNKGKIWLRNCVWAIIGIIIIGSFIFDINIFKEISWTVRIFLIILAIGFGFYGEKKSMYPRLWNYNFTMII